MINESGYMFWLMDKNQRLLLSLFMVFLCLITGCKDCKFKKCLDSSQVIDFSFKIKNVYPHATNAFTQGLVFENGFLYEGTGLLQQSTLRKVELETGKVLKYIWLKPNLFGEGITIYKDRIIQLTWKSRRGFVYKKKNFDLIREFEYSTEGWGITHDNERLIMSDGTAILYFLDPESFEVIGQLEVKDNDVPVSGLNELEFVKGYIFANIWPTERIVIIDIKTGNVRGRLDVKGILHPEDLRLPVDVLNGIAYDNDSDRLFITGKLWPNIFEIELIKKRIDKKE